MSIYALLLPGWEQFSTWGAEDGCLYAHVTRNGHADDGPDFWITPPRYPIYVTHENLVRPSARSPALTLHQCSMRWPPAPGCGGMH